MEHIKFDGWKKNYAEKFERSFENGLKNFTLEKVAKKYFAATAVCTAQAAASYGSAIICDKVAKKVKEHHSHRVDFNKDESEEVEYQAKVSNIESKCFLASIAGIAITGTVAIYKLNKMIDNQ